MANHPQHAFNPHAPFSYSPQNFPGQPPQQPFQPNLPGYINASQASSPALSSGLFPQANPTAQNPPYASAPPPPAPQASPSAVGQQQQQQTYQQQLAVQQQQQQKQQQQQQQQTQSSNVTRGPPQGAAPMAHSSNQSPSTTTPTSQQRPQFPPYQPPTTPEGLARERERITAVLKINSELLAHLSKLQSEGHGGHIGQSQAGEQQPPAQKQPSGEYALCMRALQTNIAFCASVGDGGRTRQAHSYPGPMFMNPPAKTPSLVELYQKLQALFPDWKGVQQLQHQQQQQQRQQQLAAQERARQQMQQMQQQQQQIQQQHQNSQMMQPGQGLQGLGGQGAFNFGLGHQNG